MSISVRWMSLRYLVKHQMKTRLVLISKHTCVYIFVLLGLALLTKAESSSTVLGTLKPELIVLASISHKYIPK